MPRAAVLGKPVAHSLSPVIHTSGYAAAGLAGWSYTAIECAEAELADLVAGLDADWAGLSLTMPLKAVALAVADEVAPLAATLGAANTLVRRPRGTDLAGAAGLASSLLAPGGADSAGAAGLASSLLAPGGGWFATNTDVPGMVAALAMVGVTAVDTVAVLGAGGTARAALAAAARLGAPAVTVYARRAEAVAALRPVAADLGLGLSHGQLGAIGRAGGADLLLSTVPKGAADPFVAAIDWRPSTVLFDVVYDPWPTPLAASAAAAGCRVVSGLELLLAQAAGQFELFTGVPAPTGAMRAALTAARSASPAGSAGSAGGAG